MPFMHHPEDVPFGLQPKVGDVLTPDEAKLLAFQVAYQGLGHVSPNPLVGAVFVDRHHQFLAAGAHLAVGGDHAEVQALHRVPGDRNNALNGATLYVTLEPCAHQGRTPPCAHALAKLPLAKVVYGARDVDTRTNGQGAHVLEQAGIEAYLAPEWLVHWPAALRWQNRVFFHATSTQRIFWGVKAATSLDGGLGMPGDRRSFLTGDRARAFGHFLRLNYDAIVTGWHSVHADNPELNVRHGVYKPRTPLRVVFDPKGRLSQGIAAGSYKLFAREQAKTVWCVDSSRVPTEFAAAEKKFSQAGGRVLDLPTNSEGSFQLEQLEERLWGSGIRSALAEGGAILHSRLLAAKRAHALHLFLAPQILGSGSRLAWQFGEAAELEHARTTELGPDILVEGWLRFRPKHL
jgi:diaminohydroxyphosphoribosylaminopyrimidine deaminase/5-amino-6-(5-phosphoribosylamino)uracil reductase